MVGVVNLGDEIRDRELKPMGEQAPRLVLRREAELRPEIIEDVGDMRDDERAVAQERRRERGLRRAALEHRRHRLHAAPGPSLARDVDVRRAGRLEREAHELAPPLDARPVEELVGHRLGFPRPARPRPHAVGGFDIAAGEVEKLAVARMIRLLHALDMGADRGMLLGQEFGEEVLLLRRPDDKDRAGAGDRLRHILEERLVLLDPLAVRVSWA